MGYWRKIDIVFGAIPAAILALATAPLGSVLTVSLFLGFLQALMEGRISNALSSLLWFLVFPTAFLGALSLNYVVFKGIEKFGSLKRGLRNFLIASLTLSIPCALVGGAWLYQMPLKNSSLRYLVVVLLFLVAVVDARQLFLISNSKKNSMLNQ